MNCDFDLRDYYFEALTFEDGGKVKQHLKACESCTAELEQLRVTALALRALPEEEIPRRIAFVSDKVFEPSPVARWFQWFWMSGARMAVLAAIVFACTKFIQVEPLTRVIRVTEPVATKSSFDRTAMQAVVNKAVAQAMNEAEARYDLKLQRVVAENERQKRDTMDKVATVLDSIDKRNKVLTIASNSLMETGQ